MKLSEQSAFPMLGNVGHEQNWAVEHGMTLRQYFAAVALPAMMAHYSRSGIGVCQSHDEIASESVKIADALLAQLEKQP